MSIFSTDPCFELQRMADILSVSPETLQEKGCRWFVHSLIKERRTIPTIMLFRELTGASLMEMKVIVDNAQQLIAPEYDPIWEALESGDQEPLYRWLSRNGIWRSEETCRAMAALFHRTFALRRQRRALLGLLHQGGQRHLLGIMGQRQHALQQRLSKMQAEWEGDLFDVDLP